MAQAPRTIIVVVLLLTFAGATQKLAAQAGAIAHWKLDEGDGGTAADSSGNGHDGTLEGGVAWAAEGIASGSMEFDGINGYVQTALFEELRNAENFSISAWFKTNVTDSGQQHILWIGDLSGNGWGGQSELHIGINHFGFSNKLVFYYGTGTDTDGQCINIASLDDFTDTGEWHRLVGVIENADGPIVTGTLYLDGEVMEPFVDGFENDGVVFPTTDTTEFPPDRLGWNTALRIGSPGAARRYFDGLIDDVTVYDRALAQGETGELAVEPRGKLATTWATIRVRR